MESKADVLRLIAWLISIIAVLGSLYFSEIRGFVPCELCWYQRVLMYPLAVVLGVGFYRRDRNVGFYALPFSVVGTGLAFVHYLHQKTDWFDQAIACTQGVPCSGEYINWLGFITIPFLSLTAFFIITCLLLVASRQAENSA